jgi:HPr kinase/phosphorylase
MKVYDPPESHEHRGVTVGTLLDDSSLGVRFRIIAGHAGLTRRIEHPRIQKSGLALVGHAHGLVPQRVQMLGETETSYLNNLREELQVESAAHLFRDAPCAVIVTCGATPPRAFLAEADRKGCVLVVVEEKSSVAIQAIHSALDEHLAPRSRLHGVLVDIFEVGVLLTGKSGVGKSECALELVMNGHRLVADDIVECDYRPPGMVFGEPAEKLRYYMEVRGLGILNIKDLYGVTAVRDRKRVDLCVELELWKEGAEFDRIGVEDQYREILGVPIRSVRLPVQPGRNMSSIIEIAARAELLRRAGHHPAKEFIDSIDSTRFDPKAFRPPSHDAYLRGITESAAPPPTHGTHESWPADLTTPRGGTRKK